MDVNREGYIVEHKDHCMVVDTDYHMGYQERLVAPELAPKPQKN